MTEVLSTEAYVSVESPTRLEPAELTRLRQALTDAAQVEDVGQPQRIRALPAQTPDSDDLQAQRDHARLLLNIRQRREREFGVGLLADPAFDILLDVFLRQVDGYMVSVGSACGAAGVPQTTALRHLTLLIDGGLIARKASAADQRRQYVYLTDKGFAGMQRILATA